MNDGSSFNSSSVSSKIQVDHLRRYAIVYIRQSTMEQVASNLESKSRQYALVDRAKNLGWSDKLIEVIDEDQGKSAAQVDERHGFGRLIAKIGMGEVGIILGLEVSRLARNNKDWYQLLDLCAIFDTLIADYEGIYNPRSYNDRLLLGLKGTMSEAELHIMRNRLTAGLENKAKRGELILGLPVGFCISEEGKIELEPNELVQHTIKTIFEKFRKLGSIFAVFREMYDERTRFPFRKDVMGRKEVDWQLPTYRGIRSILTNPCYAGAYSFGRTTTIKTVSEDGTIKKHPGSYLNRERWPVLIIDHHPGYITWVDFEEIQKRIDSNRRFSPRPGPVKGGSSILSGLVRCGICGRSMVINYTGVKSNCPRFTCQGELMLKGRRGCQSFGARRFEDKITVVLLSILEPRAIEAAILALDDFEKQRKRQIRKLDLEVERATHAEDCARRRYENVEPENRLVARVLEKKWETSMAEHDEAKKVRERKIATLPCPLTEPEKTELKEILEHLPKLWESPTTKHEDRKEIVRILIHHIETRVDTDQRRLHYAIHWMTGQVMTDNVKLPRTGEHRYTTSDTDLEMIRKLAQDHSDNEIAAHLSRAGRTSPYGLPWTEARVRSIRIQHKIMKPEHRPENYITCNETRRILNIRYSTFHDLVAQGKLKAIQVYRNTRWRVPREDVEKLVSRPNK